MLDLCVGDLNTHVASLAGNDLCQVKKLKAIPTERDRNSGSEASKWTMSADTNKVTAHRQTEDTGQQEPYCKQQKWSSGQPIKL